jgi:tetratricopeptide (TPR) repeat protein
MQSEMSASSPMAPLPKDQAQAVQAAADGLAAKPESAYTGQDWASRGYAAINQPDFDAALHYFNQALKHGGTETDQARWLFARAWLLGRLNRNDEAIEAYSEVERRFGQGTELSLQEQVASALVSKGFRLGEMGRNEDAIEAYSEVERRFGQRTELPLLEQVAMAMVNKGVRLAKMGRNEDAIETYKEVERRFASRPEPPLAEVGRRAQDAIGAQPPADPI